MITKGICYRGLTVDELIAWAELVLAGLGWRPELLRRYACIRIRQLATESGAVRVGYFQRLQDPDGRVWLILESRPDLEPTLHAVHAALCHPPHPAAVVETLEIPALSRER